MYFNDRGTEQSKQGIGLRCP